MTTTNWPQTTQSSWRRFLETYEPLRPDLFKYCRYLTRSAWDAEDLTQDTLGRAFVTLAQMGAEPANPKAWLFRVASNLWIDRKRAERAMVLSSDDVVAAASSSSAWSTTEGEPRATREAAGTLLVRLSPQERAAVVLKDAFDFSLEEVAGMLGSTVGAIKTALHRGRGKLADEAAVEPEVAPQPRALDAFCRAFNQGDLEGLTALLLDTAVVHVVGATTQYGPEAARRTVLQGMLFGTRLMASAQNPLDPTLTAGVLPELPRVEPHLCRGRWVLAHWYRHEDGEAVRAFTTLVLEGDRVARLDNYFYSPELAAELGAELGLPVRSNGHLWWRKETP